MRIIETTQAQPIQLQSVRIIETTQAQPIQLPYVVETTGIQQIREDDSPAEQEEYGQINSGQDDDQDPYPGDYNIWVCYSGCPICLRNADAGPVKAGDAFPSGHTMPPAHHHCNCDLEAMTPDEWRARARATMRHKHARPRP